MGPKLVATNLEYQKRANLHGITIFRPKQCNIRSKLIAL